MNNSAKRTALPPRKLQRAALTMSVAVASALSVLASESGAQTQTEENVGASASSATLTPFSDWVAQRTLVVAGTNFNDALYSTPKGTGYDGVAALFIERADGNFICTGALLEGGLNLLTAAHCLANESGVNVTNSVTAVFFTPGQPASARELIFSAATYVNPLYTGQVVDAHDVAIVRLAAAPSAGILSSAYSLYMGNPFTQAGIAVGSGATGTGLTGATQSGGFTLADRRAGLNTVDFSWTDPRFLGFFDDGNFFGTADPYGLVADFDNGTSARNSACIITGLAQFAWGAGARCGGGFGPSEVNLGGGDSGGPLFINGQIAGVASYGLTFRSGLGDSDNIVNSTFGEFSGWASTSYNAVWIATVPEPSSFVLVGVGLFVLVGVAKRRNRVS